MINVYLTDKGRKIYDLVMPEVEAMNRQGVADLSLKEQEQLKSLLRSLLSYFDKITILYF